MDVPETRENSIVRARIGRRISGRRPRGEPLARRLVITRPGARAMQIYTSYLIIKTYYAVGDKPRPRAEGSPENLSSLAYLVAVVISRDMYTRGEKEQGRRRRRRWRGGACRDARSLSLSREGGREGGRATRWFSLMGSQSRRKTEVTCICMRVCARGSPRHRDNKARFIVLR